MIKGWRNNPEWVRYYAEKKEKQLAAELFSRRLEIEREQMRIGDVVEWLNPEIIKETA